MDTSAPAPMPHDLSPWSMFLMADPVVKAVMVLLALASVACWTVIIEKLATLRRLRREARALAEAASGDRVPTTPPDRHDLAAAALRAGLPEWRRGQGANETGGEYRVRLDGAMRKAVGRALRRAEPGLQLLATTGSVAPFVGLFGTVWGIMNSFSGIAASNDTSLAVVAPGIAEALFATAIGLVAAIPAVVAYNRLSAALAALRREALGAATELAHRLARAAEAAAPSGVAEARAPRLGPAE
jgi:biopolymer transport protein TolQ